MVEVKGVEELKRTMRRLNREMRKELNALLMELGEELADDMRQRAPRGATGRLSEGITAEKRRGKVVVGPSIDTPYGRFVEFGTKFVPARPFARPTFDTRWRDIHAKAAKWLGGKLGQITQRSR